MSKHTEKPKKPQTVPSIRAMKGKQPIVMLTAYSASHAAILDPHVDMLLVGDSLGMVLYGMESTVPVDLETMIRHGQAVAKAAKHACVVVDMPFGSYQESKEQAFASAARVMKETGCAAVKLEGGAEMAETVAFLTARGIPVVAHIGLMPQRVHVYGGYRYQGRTDEDKAAILADAKALEEAGAFVVLMECLEAGFAGDVTQALSVPTIGIGAGAGCDGQVLVMEDMAGLFERNASFVKQYGNMRGLIEQAAKDYAKEVREGSYPDAAHSFEG